MNISVASGKGGTGKTTFAVNLAHVLSTRGDRAQLLDCDVEEPNAHLFLKPSFTEQHDVTVRRPVPDESRCTGCGLCADACRFNAIAVVKGTPLVFPELCHACGVCTFVCPEGVFREEKSPVGTVQSSRDGGRATFVHGLLNIGESMAPRVVKAVKEHIDADAVSIIDAAPGTACPVVAAVEGTDVSVLVTEPTPFGLHDLRLAAAMTTGMDIPTGIVINRSNGQDRIIADWAASVDLPIVGRIPFKREYAETYSTGHLLVEEHAELVSVFTDIFTRVCALRGRAMPRAVIPEDMPEPGSTACDSATGPTSAHRELAIISGKGGTGKTTITASFAVLAGHQILADNDVDAADLHLLLDPEPCEVQPFVGGIRATVDSERCIGCGRCAEVCRFNAFSFDGPANNVVGKTWQVQPHLCEGCGFCARVCPMGAIWEEEAVTGKWYVSTTSCGPMVHARLGIAEENSGRLVTQVRKRASDLAASADVDMILADGPPGTGCPVIASVSGADLVLVVTEPTVSGLHDMERVLELATHFGVEAVVLINKADINPKQAGRIEAIAAARGARVIARVPFDPAVNAALMDGRTVVEGSESPAADAIRSTWNEIQQVLAGAGPGRNSHTREKGSAT